MPESNHPPIPALCRQRLLNSCCKADSADEHGGPADGEAVVAPSHTLVGLQTPAEADKTSEGVGGR